MLSVNSVEGGLEDRSEGGTPAEKKGTPAEGGTPAEEEGTSAGDGGRPAETQAEEEGTPAEEEGTSAEDGGRPAEEKDGQVEKDRPVEDDRHGVEGKHAEAQLPEDGHVIDRHVEGLVSLAILQISGLQF